MRKMVLLGIVSVVACALPARAAGGSISGSVNDPDGRALANICVDAQGPTERSAATASDGSFSIEGLSDGEYILGFTDCGANGVVDEFWRDKPSQAVADAIAVRDGASVTGIDAVMDHGGTIGGRVTDPNGDPLEGVCVGIDAADLTSGIGAGTTSDGTYAVRVTAGAYLVRFVDCEHVRFVDQWYNNKPTPESADRVLVTSGAMISGIDAVLRPEDPDPSIDMLLVDTADPVARLEDVTIFLSNDGVVSADSTLNIEACPRTIGPCQPIVRQDQPLAAHAQLQETFTWDASRWVGEATIRATLISPIDRNPSNNELTRRACILTPCAGVGAHAP